MRSPAALKIIDSIQAEVAKSGIVSDNLVKALKELRPLAIQEEDASLTKVIRLTYEHISENGSFNIPIPEDEEVVEDGEFEDIASSETEIERKEIADDDFEAKRESLSYLLSIMKNCDTNAVNREDLLAYRDLLMVY